MASQAVSIKPGATSHPGNHKRKRLTDAVELHSFIEGTRVIRLRMDEIEDIADEFDEVCDDPRHVGQEPSVIVARRRKLSENTVDRCLRISRHAHKRAYHAQRTGMLNAMSMAGNVLRSALGGAA